MVEISWPLNLPKPSSGNWTATSKSPYITDKSEIGAGLKRKRYTRSLKQYSFSLELNDSQLSLIWDFFEKTCDEGGKAFIWAHPITGKEYRVRFMSEIIERNIQASYWNVDVELQEI